MTTGKRRPRRRIRRTNSDRAESKSLA